MPNYRPPHITSPMANVLPNGCEETFIRQRVFGFRRSHERVYVQAHFELLGA